MLLSMLADTLPSRLHVALIPDGNGRWAEARGRPRAAGYAAGAEAVRRAIEAAPENNIGTLTFFAFSSDNWQRPAEEVHTLLRVFEGFLREQADEACDGNVKLRVIGRRDRFPGSLQEAIVEAELATADSTGLLVRLAMDYSARDAILRAACRLYTSMEVSREAFARLLGGLSPEAPPAPDVDLLIRTGGEQRLSDFLLWECAYSELYFTPTLWPEFTAADLAIAVAEYHRRERRFGRVPAAVA
jgi:undecaprenyl diphosphate synthase